MRNFRNSRLQTQTCSDSCVRDCSSCGSVILRTSPESRLWDVLRIEYMEGKSVLCSKGRLHTCHVENKIANGKSYGVSVLLMCECDVQMIITLHLYIYKKKPG
jgi:hypothetical protein